MTRRGLTRATMVAALAAATVVAVPVGLLARRRPGAPPAPAPVPAAVNPPTLAEFHRFGEKARKIAALVQNAPTSRPSASDGAEVLGWTLRDPDWRIRVRAMAVLPFVGDRERAVDVLVACLRDREPASSGDGNVPLYATTYLADMGATRAAPDVEDWLAYLEGGAPYDQRTRAAMLKKGREDLHRLKNPAAARPARDPAE